MRAHPRRAEVLKRTFACTPILADQRIICFKSKIIFTALSMSYYTLPSYVCKRAHTTTHEHKHTHAPHLYRQAVIATGTLAFDCMAIRHSPSNVPACASSYSFLVYLSLWQATCQTNLKQLYNLSNSKTLTA